MRPCAMNGVSLPVSIGGATFNSRRSQYVSVFVIAALSANGTSERCIERRVQCLLHRLVIAQRVDNRKPASRGERQALSDQNRGANQHASRGAFIKARVLQA